MLAFQNVFCWLNYKNSLFFSTNSHLSSIQTLSMSMSKHCSVKLSHYHEFQVMDHFSCCKSEETKQRCLLEGDKILQQ